MTIGIRPLVPDDWPRIRAIYEQGIATGDATFETEAPDWEVWNRSHLASCRLVAEQEGRVVGWAALSPVSDRCAYGGVGEVSVYVDEAGRGRGIGSALMEALVAASEREGLWTLQAGIFPENASSIRAHEKAGFRIVGRRARLGRLAGRWRDVLLLERRSPVVGRDG